MTPTNYQDLKYNELKKLASERGLDASGTKEDLISRLSEADGGAASSDGEKSKGEAGAGSGENQSNQSDEDDGETSKSEQPNSKDSNIEAKAKKLEPQLQNKADAALREDARKMKAHLEAQPKVMIMIPFDAGVNPEQAKKIPFHLNLNGYAIDLPRGQYIEVPKQVAEIIKERLESEGKIGQQWRTDMDAKRQEALS